MPDDKNLTPETGSEEPVNSAEPAEETAEKPVDAPVEETVEAVEPEASLENETPEVVYEAAAGMREYVYGEPVKTQAEQPAEKAEKPKRKKHFPTAALIAILCVVCVLGSAAAGYFGALYAGKVSPIIEKEKPVILYRSVSTTAETAEEASRADIIELIAPSVVEITTEETITSFYQYISQGAGSGVIVSEDGYILTCNHVISSSSGAGYVSTVNVRLNDGTTYTAEIIGSDADSDLAVIKINPDKALTPAVLFNSETSKLRPGDDALVVGNPLGMLGGSVSAGIISALERKITVEDTAMKLMQVDAAVNPGNSGGGLFNSHGELIGIINAKYSDSGIEGLGFAIPVSTIDTVLPQLIEYGFVRGKVIIGISMRNVTSADAAYYYYGRSAIGVYVDTVREGYNDKVLQRGDRIIAVAGKEISSYTDIKEILAEASVGDVISFTISRQTGKTAEIITVDVQCFESIPEGKTLNFNN